MGLDFELYKKKKEQNIEEFFNEDYSVVNNASLAYGRKSWELVHELASDEDVNNGYGILTKDRWDSLEKKLELIGDKLTEIDDAYDKRDEAEEVSYPKLHFTDEHKKLINTYEAWYYKVFNDTPMLGFEFSIGYISSFYNAKDKIREVLDDPDYEVLMDISY